MKYLITTIAAVVLVGCGRFENSATAPEAKPVEPVAEVPAQPSPPPVEAKPDEPVAEASQPEPPTAKAPDISIHDAAWKGNIEVVMQHIAAGTNLNVKNVHRLGQHRTPLYYAAKRGHKDIVMLLIAADADVNVKFENGKTTLDWLSSSGEMADLLRKHGGKRGNELKVHRK